MGARTKTTISFNYILPIATQKKEKTKLYLKVRITAYAFGWKKISFGPFMPVVDYYDTNA